MSLAEFLNEMEAYDDEMNKEAAELEKMAAEEEAAGRIMARGFMDELNKLAQDMKFKPEVIQQTRTNKGGIQQPKKPGQLGGYEAKGPPPPRSSVVSPGAGAGTKATQKKFRTSAYE